MMLQCLFLLAVVHTAAAGSPFSTSNFDAYGSAGSRESHRTKVLPTAFSQAKLFADHMVIQHDAPAPVWGFDVPGSTVTVTIRGGNSWSNVTDATGLWKVTLSSHGMGGPHIIDFSSTSGGSSSIEDVYFGSVFVCGGQSNMQFSLSGALNSTELIADSVNYPLIRLFTVGQGGGMNDNAPLQEFTHIEQTWTVASPAAVGNGDFSYFSAVCYLFAREIQQALGSPTLPISLISANWGGTCLSSWTPADGAAAQACGMTGTSGHANLYNGLIAPLTVGPLALDGFLWSQGECDADCNNTEYYACAFPKFIGDWRAKFNSPEAFFSFQVLPAYVNDSGRFNPYSLPFERAAQLTGLSAGGLVHAANTIDLGDALAPHGSVHPRDKLSVARRMSYAARALIFGDTSVPYLAPAYSGAVVGSGGGGALTVTVSFKSPPPSSGTLSLRPAACPVGIGGLPASECSWFKVQTQDGAWHNSTGVDLTGDSKSLVLTVGGVTAGSAVNATRGFFSPWPVVVLFSAEGLPVLPWWEEL